ncbi:MAG TPA: hypothetical protein IAA63_05650 [Candidatus Pullilachnospira stercoravium]|uniref:Uncharacterized protein n=1 Tax=Candidatus Pullilachnospira stercoravium TaxID=2840913 RepID=A0A9D1T5X0_9FIRM|nr:hypothetical protein [Candidatus Pullilachnospira stercoravium]
MRCPNCHSVVGNNRGICQYCGYDIGKYVREVQGGSEPTWYTGMGMEENTADYYRKAYEEERRRNDHFKIMILYTLLGGLLALNLLELVVLVFCL